MWYKSEIYFATVAHLISKMFWPFIYRSSHLKQHCHMLTILSRRRRPHFRSRNVHRFAGLHFFHVFCLQQVHHRILRFWWRISVLLFSHGPIHEKKNITILRHLWSNCGRACPFFTVCLCLVACWTLPYYCQNILDESWISKLKSKLTPWCSLIVRKPLFCSAVCGYFVAWNMCSKYTTLHLQPCHRAQRFIK